LREPAVLKKEQFTPRRKVAEDRKGKKTGRDNALPPAYHGAIVTGSGLNLSSFFFPKLTVCAER